MQNPGKLVLEGITHLENGSWETALRLFDRAIAIREASDWKNDPPAAWGLAAAHINRSDALRRTGHLPEAILSLHLAILAMDHVPLSGHPSHPDRLILAWINLATAHDDSAQASQATEAFTQAESLLATWGAGSTPNRISLAAMFHANRARFLIGAGKPVASWRDASHAVRLLDSLGSPRGIASACIEARGILCQALALILETPDGTKLETDWIARATDAAEEALALARTTDYHGQWLTGLVRYCAKIYRICQPHFLGEFLLENSTLIQNPTHISAEFSLARSELTARVLAAPHDTELVIRETATLRKLQLAETRLLTHPAAPAA